MAKKKLTVNDESDKKKELAMEIAKLSYEQSLEELDIILNRLKMLYNDIKSSSNNNDKSLLIDMIKIINISKDFLKYEIQKQKMLRKK